jgi:phosphoglycolate phosphatase-like HAD superfamily hydrolase
MVGDKNRDIEAAQKVQVNTVLVAQDGRRHQANFVAGNLWEAAHIIVKQ